MKDNLELERNDIAIDSDMEVDGDIGQEITVYIETWFDVDKKFGVHTSADEGAWLNMYGKFNPLRSALSARSAGMMAPRTLTMSRPLVNRSSLKI
jgi:hypothetical protein